MKLSSDKTKDIEKGNDLKVPFLILFCFYLILIIYLFVCMFVCLFINLFMLFSTVMISKLALYMFRIFQNTYLLIHPFLLTYTDLLIHNY